MNRTEVQMLASPLVSVTMELLIGGHHDWVIHDTPRYASAFIQQDADDRDLVGLSPMSPKGG